MYALSVPAKINLPKRVVFVFTESWSYVITYCKKPTVLFHAHVCKLSYLQVKPKSSFIYYYGEHVDNATYKPSNGEEKYDIPDGDVLNLEPNIPIRPR